MTLSVTPVDDPPTATNDGGGATFSATEDGTLTVPAPGVLGNDTDPDGDPLTAVLVTGPAHGTIVFNPDGSFVYTPAADYTGPDSFTYTVSDGDQSSAPATVTLNVNPANDPPTAVANTYSLAEDRTLTVPAGSGLLGNDSDIDAGTTLTAVLVTGPTQRHADAQSGRQLHLRAGIRTSTASTRSPTRSATAPRPARRSQSR